MAPEMIAATPRPEHVVRVMFVDGEVRDVDITPLLDTEVFAPLRDQQGPDQGSGAQHRGLSDFRHYWRG